MSRGSSGMRNGDHETATMTSVTTTVVQRWRLTMSYGHARSLNTLPVFDEDEQIPNRCQCWQGKAKDPP